MAESVLKKGDPYSKIPVTVGTIPLGTSNVHVAAATIGANAALTFNLQIYPVYPAITLWNMTFSIFVDTVDLDHLYPTGSAVLGMSNLITVSSWVDVASSGRVSGMRYLRIHMVNSDSSPHDITVWFKGFLQTGLASGDVS